MLLSNIFARNNLQMELHFRTADLDSRERGLPFWRFPPLTYYTETYLGV